MYRLIIAAAFLFGLVVGSSTYGYTQSPARATSESPASYGKAQADRGKVVYGQYCSTCHLETLKGKCTENLSSTTYLCGATGSAPPLVGASFLKRFYSVGDLYSRVRWTMPAPGENTLSTQDNLAVNRTGAADSFTTRHEHGFRLMGIGYTGKCPVMGAHEGGGGVVSIFQVGREMRQVWIVWTGFQEQHRA